MARTGTLTYSALIERIEYFAAPSACTDIYHAKACTFLRSADDEQRAQLHARFPPPLKSTATATGVHSYKQCLLSTLGVKDLDCTVYR